jgi:prephenate dehydrogenase
MAELGLSRVAVIGCGLIGGSWAVALRRNRPDVRVAGLDLPDRLAAVRDARVADEVADLREGAAILAQSELVVLAAPVESILDLLDEIAPHLRPGAIVTDVGSTKTVVMEKARAALPPAVHFIGGHPIAGSERSGVEAADPLLFHDRIYLLCPSSDTPSDALLAVIGAVEALQAIPVCVEADEHDRLMAAVSHLPQLAAIALMDSALTLDRSHQMLETAAGRGFLDLTRIAASEYRVWDGILRTNKDAIREALDRFAASLARVRDAFERDELAGLWEAVSRRRRKMSLDTQPARRRPDLRKLIDEYDEQLLKTLGNRRRLAQKIGKLKANQSAPILDPDRERRLLAKRAEWGKALALPPEFVEALFRLIMDDSKHAQAEKS